MFALPFDVNGDGRLDMVFGSKGKGASVGWLEAPPGDRRDLGKWAYHRLYEAGWIMSIRAVDLDGDGDDDVVFSDRKGNSSGVWWLEKVAAPRFFAQPVRLGFAGEELMFIDVADLDGDGDLDLMTCEESEGLGVFWYENPAGSPGGKQ